jgi:uncharacterized protein involved in high-affinity Fe2+ transport
MKFNLGRILGSVGLMVALSVLATGCTTNSGSEDDVGGGFTELSLGDDVEFTEAGINVAGVYFQPVVMSEKAGLEKADSDAHIEADISALPGNNLGYGAGDFVPNLTVEYEIWKGATASTSEARTAYGTFMPMNASDGPHYGANVAFGGTKGVFGTYTIRFTIKAPDGYALHTDPETGMPGAAFWTTPLVAKWTFDFLEAF